MKKVTLLALVAITIVSCKNEMDISYKIQNVSAESIFVKGKDKLNNKAIDVEIGANQEMEIANYYDKDKEVMEYDPEVALGCDLIVTNHLGDTMTTDYKEDGAWGETRSSESKRTELTYSLVLSESDFQ